MHRKLGIRLYPARSLESVVSFQELTMKVFAAFLLLSTFSLAQYSGTAPLPPAKALATGQQYATMFFANDSKGLWEKMAPVMKDALKSPEDWAKFDAAAVQQIGKVGAMTNERVMPNIHDMVFTRLFASEALPVKLEMTISIQPDGLIDGFFLRPEQNPAESKYLDYKTKTTLQFPLHGEWTIYQGGRSVYDNYHAAYPDERFADDIMIIHSDGTECTGDCKKVEDFYAFGQPAFADANGKVTLAVDQYDDNPIGKPSSDNPKYGNTVVIDHGNGEFSMYAHLKRGSVKVKTGDEVKAGQQIGMVGNSGNSPIPHLHYHLQTTAVWFKGDGLPMPFASLTVNGKTLKNAEPVRGDVVDAE